MVDVTEMSPTSKREEVHTGAELLSLLYEELRRLAAHKLSQERPGQTLQATALVHEAWLRIEGSQERQWDGKIHFFAAAAQAMRRILVENARRRQRQKRGGGWDRIDIEKIQLAEPLPSNDLLALDEALTEFSQRDPSAAELVQLRFFAGLTQLQAADLLGIPRRTADRTWAYARAWLFLQIGGDQKSGP